MATPVEKIYSLKTIGFDQIMTELDALAKKFVDVKKAKQDAAKAAADTAKNVGIESVAYKEAAAALEAEKVKELELAKAIKEKTNEAKAAQLVRQEEKNRQKEAIEGNRAEANSIVAIRKERAELNAAVIRVDPGNPVEFRGNTLQYDQAIAKLKQLSAVEQDFRRQFAKDSTLVGEYTSGIIQAFKKMGIDDLVTGQVTKANGRLSELNKEFEVLKQELRSVRESGAGSLDNLEKELIANRNAAAQLEKEVGRLQTELRGTGDIGNQITTGLANGFKAMKGQLAQFVLSYVGFQAAFQGITAGIDTAKELSDATTNLEVELGKTAGGADKLVSSLAKLNTRTKLTELESIANIAAKAGVSEENLLGVTEALDKIKIAFGSDFGNVEDGTESLVKLINVFEGTGNVTGENLLRTGNAVRTLANETVASVPFLNDFAKRMAGLKGISDISLPAVLGLASGFEQFGQSSEVAGTALTKVIPKLGTDTAKYAQIAGMTQKAFSDLLKDNPAEALIRVSEALVKSKNGIEEISTAFADSQLGSGRIAAILGTVGAKADDFRKSIASAGKAYQDTGNIEDAFAKKNNNLASMMDKITKAFADAANSKLFQASLSVISTLLLALIHTLPILTTVIGLYAAGWLYANRIMILARAQLLFQTNLLPVLTLLVGGQANATRLWAIATQGAAAAMRVLTALMGSPIFRIFAATIGLGLIALESFGKSVNNVGKGFDLLKSKQAALNEAQSTARKEIGETIAKEQALLAIVKDRTLADQTRSKALSELKAIAGGYLDNLNLENVLTEKGTRLISDFNAQLERRTKLIASDAIAQRETNKLTTLYQYQYDIQTAIKTKGDVNTSQFSKEFLDAFYKQQGRSASAIGKFIGDKIGVDFTYSGENLKDFAKLVESQITEQLDKTKGALLAKTNVRNDNIKILSKGLDEAKAEVEQLGKRVQGLKAGTKEYVDATTALSEAQNNVIRKRKELYDALGKQLPGAPVLNTNGDQETQTLEDLQKQLASVNSQIAAIDKIKNRTKLQVEQLKLLRAQKADILKQIKELGGSVSGGGARSRLSGDDLDQFSLIESKRRTDIANEETYYTNIKKNRKLTYEEEVNYVNKIEGINIKYLNQKIGVLSAIKNQNDKEKEQLATFYKEKADIQLQGVNQIQEIHNKEFNERQTQLRNQLDLEISAIKEAGALVQNDPNKSATERAQNKLDSDKQILALYVKYNGDIDKLEKELVQQTTRNSREIVKAQQGTSEEIIKDRKAKELARIEDIRAEGENEITEQNIKYQNIRSAILRNEKLTLDQKDFLINRLTDANQVTILSKELETLQAQFNRKTLMYAQDNLSEEEYLKAKNAVIEKGAQLEEAIREANRKRVEDILKRKAKSVEDLVSKGAQKGAIKLFNIDEADQEEAAAAVGQAVAQSFDLAAQAMHGYYDAEQKRIQDSLAINLERLEQEKEQVKAKATSAAESEAIDKEFAAKKKAAEKAAGEEIKKSKKAELKIALVTEIANIAVAAARFGLPFGPIIFGVMSALALGRYALGVGQINAQQFAFGGEVPKRGGKFGGKRHSQGGTPFKFQGEQYEAEVDELAIIRTRNAPARNKVFQIMGTHQQIASQLNVLGGGIAFEPGAKLKRFATGGNLGATLQAPVFIPSNGNNVTNNQNGITEEQLNKILGKVDEGISATNGRIDRLQVHVNAREVVKTNDKYTKAANVGTL